MKYYYEEPEVKIPVYGETIHLSDHPAYSFGTLFRDGDRGIVVVQLKFLPAHKIARWAEVEPEIANDIYLSPNFKRFFELFAREAPYPIFQLRSIMWQLRMKPLKKEEWEIYF